MVKMVEGERRDESVVIAIDRDKGSQAALKWAVDNLLTPGETLTLVHVRVKQTLTNNGMITVMLINYMFRPLINLP